MKLKSLLRKLHFWFSLAILIPVLIVIVSGVFLQVKKEFDWIQPSTQKGSISYPDISYQQILEVASTIPDANIKSWSDVDRLDYRPQKGVVKIRANNGWEIQLDLSTAQLLSSMERRSDWIESIHDGSFFHEKAKLWLFLPAALLLLFLALSGLYMIIITLKSRYKKSARKHN